MTSSTCITRVSLSCGAFDTLEAERFSQDFPAHFHDTFAIGVVEQGSAEIRTPRGMWLADPGTILAFAPGEIHSARPVSADGYTYRMVYPAESVVRDVRESGTPEHEHGVFHAPVIHDTKIAAELARAHQMLIAGDRHAEDRFVQSLRTLVSAHFGSADRGARAVDLGMVERMRAFIGARVSQRCSIADVADACGMSPFHLIRTFRRVVGVTPHAYLVQLRVNLAQAMLARGSRVSDVAYCCGFSDQSHLTRTFKRAIGVAPGEYVRGMKRRTA